MPISASSSSVGSEHVRVNLSLTLSRRNARLSIVPRPKGASASNTRRSSSADSERAPHRGLTRHGRHNNGRGHNADRRIRWPAFSRLSLPPQAISCDLEIASISDSQARGLDKSLDAPLAQHEHVLDHILGRADVPIAVVPCELRELDEIESDLRPIAAEHRDYLRCSLISPLRTTDGHRSSMASRRSALLLRSESTRVGPDRSSRPTPGPAVERTPVHRRVVHTRVTPSALTRSGSSRSINRTAPGTAFAAASAPPSY